MIQRLIAESFSEAMGWTLLHFLWQGAVVAALLALTLAALKNKRASLRYLVSVAAMAVMLALPVFTFSIISSSPSVDQTTITTIAAPREAPRMTTTKFEADDPLAVTIETPPAEVWNLRETVSQLAPWMTSVWFAGVLLLSLRMLGGWLYTSRLKNQMTRELEDDWQRRFTRLCQQVRVSRAVRFLESALIQVPTVIGWLRPVVLIPVSALTGLTPRQLEAIVAHELAHIRRYDYLINLLQTAVEILLFYHPAIWWVSRQVRREREHCCDDLAVEVTGDAIAYARALTEIETLRSITPRLVMAADGGSLLARIQRLVGSAPQPSERSSSWIAGAIAFTIVFVLAAGAETPLLSDSAEPPSIIETDSDKPQAEKKTKPSASESPDQPDEKSEAIEESADLTSQPDDAESSSQTSSYIEEMAALGYTNMTVDELIALKNHDVTPQFIRELKAAGYDKLSVRELIRLRASGASPEAIRELKAAGLESLPFDALIRIQTHGVTASYIKEMSALGYKDLSPDQLVRAHDHGVTADFARAIQAAGYRDLSIDELIRARDHGVTPDFIREMRETGYDSLKMDQLIRLSDHGVDTEFVKGMHGAGFARASADELVRARDHGVTPDFIRKIRALGYESVTLDQFVRMQDHGVTSDYVESIRKAGYSNVSIDQLIRMRDHGVDARFIERARASGFTNLSVDQLIRLRDAGVFD
ncbi:MAG: M56 family metallopeptidase [Acidobacteriota bacterium]